MNIRLIGSLAAAVTLLVTANPSLAQGQGGRRGGNRGGATSLLSMPEVQKELKIEQAQIELLNGLRTAQGGTDRQALRNLPREEREKKMTEMRADQEKKVREILDEKQVARLKQLQVQQDGARALAEQPVADALKLTPAQRDTIRTTVEAERTALRGAFGNLANGGARPTAEERQAAMQKFRDARTANDAKILGVLTPEQKKQFESLKGAPFTFPARGQRTRQMQ